MSIIVRDIPVISEYHLVKKESVDVVFDNTEKILGEKTQINLHTNGTTVERGTTQNLEASKQIL